MCTVMIVDDERDVRHVIAEAAHQHGHKVIEAGTEREALQGLHDGNPDVISMDLSLPESDGFQVLRRLRAAGANGFAVIVSGDMNGRTQDFAEWKKLRIFDVISKPFKTAELMNRLEAAADATRQEERLCHFLDGIISRNKSSLSADLSGSGTDGE